MSYKKELNKCTETQVLSTGVRHVHL